MSFISKLFPDESKKLIKTLQPIADKIFSYEEELKTLSDETLKARSLTLKSRVMKDIEGLSGDELKQTEKKVLEAVLPEAFALVRESSRRTLHMMHYRVQVIGGILLHRGHIAEMRTGEGKTLVATLPAYLNALTGRGVHIVTVNDYLSRRDAVWMGQVYDMLGLTVAVINHQSSFMYDTTHLEKNEEEKDDAIRDEIGSYKVVYDFLKPTGRQDAYKADITYGTNNEFGFDYLRDNIGYSKDAITQHNHHYAIVDEIDSILIDEARTPLIISAPSAESSDMYMKFAHLADTLVEGDDYTVDEKQRAISLSEEGITKAETALNITNMYSVEGMKYVHHLETAVKAKALFLKEREYVVRDNEVVIVDEFTGRMQPGRRWSDGLHQAVEAKENVKIEQESRTLASITFQNYFRFYEKLAGMTGTAETSKEEFYKVYGLVVTPVPTHNSINRKDHEDFIFQTEKGKWQALAKKVKELHEKGQPVLIGTISIEKNEVV
jgi:preprotein translocase subunit SecA